MTHSKLMRPAQTAAYTQMSISKLAKLRMAGEGPRYCKVDRVVLYEQADVDAWLETRKRAATK